MSSEDEDYTTDKEVKLLQEHIAATSSSMIPWAWIRQVRHLVDTKAVQVKPVPAKITPWLYLADERFVRTHAQRRAHGITHVLTVNRMDDCTLTALQQDLQAAGIEHAYCPGLDEDNYDMIGLHWEQPCRSFLESVRRHHYDDKNNNTARVAVHCQAGMNRSGVIVAAAYMALEQQPLLAVVEHVIEQRGCVLWNRSFQKQLCLLAAREGLLGEYPTGQSNDPVVEKILAPPPTQFQW